MELFKRLYQKMRAEMNVRHIERTEHGWHLTDRDELVGRIECDEDTDGETPILVVDGKALSWDEVGRMLMRACDFVHAANDVLTERGMQLPLEGQSTTDRQTRFDRGLAVQKAVFGRMIATSRANVPLVARRV